MRPRRSRGPNPRPACHAEGRGFESHHPLPESPARKRVPSPAQPTLPTLVARSRVWVRRESSVGEAGATQPVTPSRPALRRSEPRPRAATSVLAVSSATQRDHAQTQELPRGLDVAHAAQAPGSATPPEGRGLQARFRPRLRPQRHATRSAPALSNVRVGTRHGPSGRTRRVLCLWRRANLRSFSSFPYSTASGRNAPLS
jgi:hypothetical protein